MNRWIFSTYTALFLGTGLLLLSGCGRDFSGEIAELRKQAAQRAREEAMAELDPAVVAENLGFSWPVSAPEKTLQQIRDEMNDKVTEKVAAKFPPQMIEALRKEVEDRYSLVEKGENVRFVVNGGEGVNPVAKGRFQGKNSQGRYIIGEGTYHADELSKADLAKVDPDVHQQTVETEFRQKLFMLKENRTDFGKRMFKEMFPEALKEAGYTQMNGKWITIRLLVKKQMAEQMAELAKKLEPAKQQQVFSENGFVMKNGEWRPSLKKQILGK